MAHGIWCLMKAHLDGDMKSVNRIISMKDYSERFSAGGTAKGFILRWREKQHREKGFAIPVYGIDKPQGTPVQARIWQGQWIAECDVCGGCEFISPDEPLFFCFGCTNRINGHYVRPVIVPANYKQIEAEVLKRPVDDAMGTTDLERAGLARAQVIVVLDNGIELPLTRSWNPSETIDDLKNQNSLLHGLKIKERVTYKVTSRKNNEPEKLKRKESDH